MSIKTTKYLAVVELSLSEDKIRELETWEVLPEDFLSSIISDHVQDRGVLCKTAIIEGNLYSDVKEYAHTVANNKAVEELEAEILEAKACVGGNCDD